ncbi:MAG: hypothetical protein KAT75_02545, partial [Dehalococcoidia bacterium]|nr:hypothetical protein [Dehalococcoidia bacterium]
MKNMRAIATMLAIVAVVAALGAVLVQAPYPLRAAPGPVIAYEPDTFNFTAVEEGADPAPQTLEIWNGEDGILCWQVTDDAGWLSLSPTSGASEGEKNEATVGVDISGLSAGIYSGNITITDPGALNNPQTVPVSLSLAPRIEYSPESFTFTTVCCGDPPSETLNIRGTNVGEATRWSLDVTYGAGEPTGWLDLDPNSGASFCEWDEVEVS